MSRDRVPQGRTRGVFFLAARRSPRNVEGASARQSRGPARPGIVVFAGPPEIKSAMRHVSAALLFLPLTVAASSSLVFADWVVLRDGRRLHGVDLERRGDRYHFTLESGRTVAIPGRLVERHEIGPPDETVQLDGKPVSLREKIRHARREAERRETAQVDLLERWARHGETPRGEEARREFEALSAPERERALGAALARSALRVARALAAEKLVAFKTSHAVQALAAAAVRDTDRDVRRASLRALRVIRHERTSDYLIPHLASRQERHRVRAANALGAFPGERAVPALLAVATKRWSDFGRSYFFQGTQRAYIADYELVSGGTGFSIVEVADPVVRTTQTGVVLDVNVRTVELRAYSRALARLTGEDFGTDMRRWASWWKAHRPERAGE